MREESEYKCISRNWRYTAMKGQCPTPSPHVLTNQDLSHFGTNCLNQHYSPKSAWSPKTRDV